MEGVKDFASSLAECPFQPIINIYASPNLAQENAHSRRPGIPKGGRSFCYCIERNGVPVHAVDNIILGISIFDLLSQVPLKMFTFLINTTNKIYLVIPIRNRPASIFIVKILKISWTKIKNFINKIKNFINKNHKFHGQKSQISWTKIKNFINKIKNFINKNHKFHGQKSQISWTKIKNFTNKNQKSTIL